ncbi:MAG TPA: hypothetical protein V6D29_05625 [Leptolyngbyaceae cyanobacterium]
MQLTIFKYCQEQQRDRTEAPIRLAWADVSPTPGQAVGMGQERRWQVAQVHTFTPAVEASITAVHLALIALPDNIPAQADWDCWRYKHLAPHENIYIHLEDIGLPELGIGFNCLNQPPKLGQHLFAGEPTGQGTQLRPVPRPWQIDRYDTYTPAEANSPYTAVYLNWCKAVSRQLSAV